MSKKSAMPLAPAFYNIPFQDILIKARALARLLIDCPARDQIANSLGALVAGVSILRLHGASREFVERWVLERIAGVYGDDDVPSAPACDPDMPPGSTVH